MVKEIHTKAFNCYPEGPDTDYGPMYNERVRVVIEQSWPWDDEQEKEMKDVLKEHYDVSRVLTDEDEKEEADYWEKEAERLRQLPFKIE